MSLPLSIFIIAKDEEDRLGYTLESIKGLSDDVVVVDSGSTDGTVALAESFGARAVFNAWNGYGPQKVFAESLCRHDWVLNLDADEALTPELLGEIRALFAPAPKAHAYSLRIMLLLPGQEKLPRFGAGTVQVRLYHRAHAGFKDAYVHDSVTVHEGKPVLLKHPVIHRSFRSLSHTVAKINSYSSMQAEDMAKKGRYPGTLTVVMTPLLAFFKAYVLRRYALYGTEGFIWSWNYAFARLLRLSKAREAGRR